MGIKRKRGIVSSATWPRDGVATLAEAAAFLRVSIRTLRGLTDRGDLPLAKVGIRERRIAWTVLHAYANGSLTKQSP